MTQWLAAAALCALLAGSASAFTLLAQEREVSVEITRTTHRCPFGIGHPLCMVSSPDNTQVTTETFSDSESAPSLADWSATAAVPGFAASSSLASTASATTLHAQASRDAHPPQASYFITGCCTMNNVFQTHETHSRYAMQFSLAEATSYTLEGLLSVANSWAAFELARVRLTGPGGAVIELHELDPDDCDDAIDCALDTEFSETGVLAPGVYEISAEMTGAAGSSINQFIIAVDNADYELTLTLTPAPPVVPALPAAGAALLAGLLAAGSRLSRRTPIRMPGGSEASRWRIEGFCSAVWPPRRS